MVTEKRENRLSVNNQRLSFKFIVASVIAVLLIAITTFYWFLSKNTVKLSTSIFQPGAAVFVSKLSPVMVSLLVNSDSWQSLEKQREISELKNSLLAKTNIDFNDDIKPWLSNEITLAVTSEDIDRDPENGLQPGYLMALATNNPAKSHEFVELLFSKRNLAGKNLEVEQYKGVKLLYDIPELTTLKKIPKSQSSSQNSLAGAVVDHFVLFANDLKVVKEAVNNIQAPNLNLSSDAEYQKAVKELPQNAVALAFLKLPQLAKWQGLELAESTYNSQLISLVLNPQGLLLESTFLTSLNLTSSKVASVSTPLSKPVDALKYIPESASLAIAGTNLTNLNNSDLAQLWQQGTATIYGSAPEAISRLLPPLVNLEQRWGLDLSEDIFSWIGGEYALAILPNQERNTNYNWVFVVEKLPQLEEGINQLNKIAMNKGFNVSFLNLKNQKIAVWTELKAQKEKADITVEAKIKGAHANLNNYEIFTSDLAMMEKIITHQEQPLIENTNFQDSIANLPQPNQGYIYIDWKKSQEFIENQQPIIKFVEVLGKPLFKNLRSLTLSNYSPDTKTLKGGIFLQWEN